MIRKLLSSLLGMVVVLTWWTIRGNDHPVESLKSLPPKVWDGGGGTVSIALETTVPGRLSMEFAERKDKGRETTAWEEVAAGTHSWSVEVPHNAGGYIDFGSDKAKPGDRMAWSISYNGRRVARETQALDHPLKDNEVLGLQQYYKDYSRPGAAVDDNEDDDD